MFDKNLSISKGKIDEIEYFKKIMLSWNHGSREEQAGGF